MNASSSTVGFLSAVFTTERASSFERKKNSSVLFPTVLLGPGWQALLDRLADCMHATGEGESKLQSVRR